MSDHSADPCQWLDVQQCQRETTYLGCNRQLVRLTSSSKERTWTQLVEERVGNLQHNSFEGNLAHLVSKLHPDALYGD